MEKITVDGKPVKQWAEERVTKENAMPTPPTHTPTPWYLAELGNHYWFSQAPNGKLGFTPMINQFMNKSNAAFIVECVNQHAALQAAKAELLQSLKDVLSCYKRVWADAGKDQKGSLYIGIAAQAIARAEGK